MHKSLCAVHAVDIDSGRVEGSLIWPFGNQIFAIDWIDARRASGFPFSAKRKRAREREKVLFYGFIIKGSKQVRRDKEETPRRARAQNKKRQS